jgi:hypothetical protein
LSNTHHVKKQGKRNRWEFYKLCVLVKERESNKAKEESVKGSEPTKATTTSGQTLIEKGASGFISFQDLKYEHVVWPCFFVMRHKTTSSTKAGRANKPIPKTCKQASLFGIANQGQGYCV